jgi:predicted Zn-dependent protease with MMP-like domain
MAGKITRLEKLAMDEVSSVIAALPAPLAEPARRVPVVFKARPDSDDGQDDDLLGLFTGPELADENSELLPPQIILFLENLWDEAAGNKSAFRKEVRITYLHELGHYLGLDEDELMKRGLE